MTLVLQSRLTPHVVVLFSLTHKGNFSIVSSLKGAFLSLPEQPFFFHHEPSFLNFVVLFCDDILAPLTSRKDILLSAAYIPYWVAENRS